MRCTTTHLPTCLAVAALLVLAACTDHDPTGFAKPPQPEPPPGGMRMLSCTASVRAKTLECGGGGADVGSASAAIIGGQGRHVRLTSTGVAYDGFSTFRMDVTVENLTVQTMFGVSVFFNSGPDVTEGSGQVWVENADGEGFFTGADQPYFQYPVVLPPGDTTGPREWRFYVPPTVERFQFGVYVDAPAYFSSGWVTPSPVAAGLPLGDTLRLQATVHDVTGTVLPGEPVVWRQLLDQGVATVDSLGLVRGLREGYASFRALSGDRLGGAVQVRVYGPANPITTIESVHVQPSVVANGRDSLWVRARYSGPLPTSRMQVTLRRAPAPDRECNSTTPVSTPGGMEFRCAFVFEEGAPGGQWEVSRVEVGSNVINGWLWSTGVAPYVYVFSARPDLQGPTVDSVSLSPRTVTAGVQPLRIRVRASDAGIGVERVDAWVRSDPRNPRLTWRARHVSTTGASSVFLFEEVIPAYFYGGVFTLDSLRVTDGYGNRTTLTTGGMAARDFPNQFTVTGATPDTADPVLTAFSFSPDTVVATHQAVTFTTSASDGPQGSGVTGIILRAVKIGDPARRVGCTLEEETGAATRTLTCAVPFTAADAGTWIVDLVAFSDVMGNQRIYYPWHLEAEGYPTRFTVTPP